MTLNGEFCHHKWLRFAQNGQFLSFCRFFHLFCQNEAQIDLEWPISPDSQLFPSFTTKASHFWRNLKNFCFCSGVGVHCHIFWSSSTFLNHFTLKQLKMTHNGKFCQKSGLDWLKIANFGHFAGFSIFSPKIRLRLTLNGSSPDSQLFPSFTTTVSHFWRNIKNFHSMGGGVHQQILLSFSTFLNHFTPKWLKMTHNGNFATKVAWMSSKWAILV